MERDGRTKFSHQKEQKLLGSKQCKTDLSICMNTWVLYLKVDTLKYKGTPIVPSVIPVILSFKQIGFECMLKIKLSL